MPALPFCVSRSGTLRANSNGVPQTRQCLIRLSQCEILDRWGTTGLRGTGSNDLLVDSVFIEASHTFSFQDPALVNDRPPMRFDSPKRLAGAMVRLRVTAPQAMAREDQTVAISLRLPLPISLYRSWS